MGGAGERDTGRSTSCVTGAIGQERGWDLGVGIPCGGAGALDPSGGQKAFGEASAF